MGLVSLVVVDIVHIAGVAVFPVECDSPVPGNFNRPMPLQITLERMQIRPGVIHVLGPHASVEAVQDVRQLARVSGLDAFFRAIIETLFQALVPEVSDQWA